MPHSPCTARISLSIWETDVTMDQWQELVGHLTRKLVLLVIEFSMMIDTCFIRNFPRIGANSTTV